MNELKAKISSLYENRFESSDDRTRNVTMELFCKKVLKKYLAEAPVVLDLGCGKGEFINSCGASTRLAVDLNPAATDFLEPGVKFTLTDVENLPYKDEGVDLVFSSNMLEHLPDKEAILRTLTEAGRVLARGGRLVLLGPNIRYVYKEYWDYFDHLVPLSHLSVIEALEVCGFKAELVVPKFLPYTIKSRLPKPRFIIDLYLSFPLFWKFFGKQFLIVAQKDSAPGDD